jgi:predicted Zn-dependent protease
MRFSARLIAAYLCLTTGLLPAAAAVSTDALPELGDPSAATLSPEAERALGARTMQQIRASGAWLDDPEVNGYLDQLGHRLTSADPQEGLDFRFFAMNSSQINAFALPGGYVGVNTGLVMEADSESELASVLAHEISHVTQHHIARQLQGQSGNSLLMLAGLLAAILAGASGNGQVAEAAVASTMAGSMQSQINYTREHEQEADRIGFSLLQRAGFDPRAMASFFLRLQTATRLQDNANIPSWLRTHPLTQARIAEAQDRALASPYKQVPDSPDFHLVRALIRSYDGTADEAVARLGEQVQRSSGMHRDAARYGLAAAMLRAQKFDAALAELAKLDAAGFRHPMVEALAGQILQQAGRTDDALARYRSAMARYPNHLQLTLDYPRTLLKARRPKEAAEFAERTLYRLRDNADLHQIAAEASAALNRRTSSHLHQGEYYALTGDLREARIQFELAVAARDGSERELALAEERLGAMRRAERAERSAGGPIERRRAAHDNQLKPGSPVRALPSFTRP